MSRMRGKDSGRTRSIGNDSATLLIGGEHCPNEHQCSSWR